MIVSDEEKSQGDEINNDTDEFDDVNPTDKKLLEKYDKYPDYLRVTFRKPAQFFDNLEPFNSANKHSLTKVLNKKSQEQLLEQLFPLTLYIQLVPELNILTVMVAGMSESMTTDALLSDLLCESDQGGQLMIDELSSI